MPRFSNRPALALFGGGVSLAAALVFAPPAASPGHPSATLPTGETCAQFRNGGIDMPTPYPETPKVDLTMYRSKDWRTNDLGSGKWVGAIHRNDKNAGDDSPLFQGLKPGDDGCLLFVLYTNALGDTASDAYLQLASAPLATKFQHSLICNHKTPHPPDVAPVVDSLADQCPDSSIVTFTFQALSGATVSKSWIATRAGVARDFQHTIDADNRRGGLYALRMSPSEMQSLVRLLGAVGPWFPCAESGCCRVF